MRMAGALCESARDGEGLDGGVAIDEIAQCVGDVVVVIVAK